MRAARCTPQTGSSTADHKRRPLKLRMEALEPRAMLSASPSPGNLICLPNLSHFTTPGPGGLSPAQVLHAYGFDQVSWKGFGETIAIVDACDDPTVAADLHAFDVQFGLADPKLTVTKMNFYGVAPTYDPLWAEEISLDVQWAHAIAPKANILLVEAASPSLGSLLAAVDYARCQPGVDVVSMSWGGPEFSTEGTFDSYFTTPAGHGNVTFVASSGDSGAPASWPSISKNVLSVGGTTLSLGTNNDYAGEAAWSRSGGGYSPYEIEPNYQHGVQTTGYRSNPDVAYDADPATGFAIYDNGSWVTVGGTSAGAPQWAGLIARADQARVAAGKNRLNIAPQAIYSLPKADFHDITVGNNGYAAGPGYDAATGRGSPIAQLVIRDLITYRNPTAVSASTTMFAAPSTSTFGQFLEAGSGIASSGLAASGQSSSTLSAELISAAYVDVLPSRFSAVDSTTDSSTPNWSSEERVAPRSTVADHELVSLAAGSLSRSSRVEFSLGDDSGLEQSSASPSDSNLQQDLIDACFADPNDLMGELDVAA